MSTYFEKKKKYSFEVEGFDENTFGVISFEGFEALSTPYHFDIMLVTDEQELDIDAVLKGAVRFTIHREGGDDVFFSGVLANFEEIREHNDFVFYRALLVPRLWRLDLNHQNQVFLSVAPRDLITRCLNDCGLLSGEDFEFRLQKAYPTMDYVCQYGETHFNFISRWAEREGIYYFFEQLTGGEKIVFTDTKIVHKDLDINPRIRYSPPSGLETHFHKENISRIRCRKKILPKKVFLKDYDYEHPSLVVDGEAAADSDGQGEKYIYYEHFKTPAEGRRLAGIRAEEILSEKSVFRGDSGVPFLSPGYKFKLKRHYRDTFNRRYLVTGVSHKGHQTGYLVAGIVQDLSKFEKEPEYRNSFTAIASNVQFRPEQRAQIPRIPGTIHAFVDAAGAGVYAEIDSQGRYKIRLPFDLNSAHGPGQASWYVRMMQPYGGSNHGFHFPLHKNTEVILTFIGGHPDRPVIAGAIPNPETASPVLGPIQTKSRITTLGQNKIHIEDLAGSQRIHMQSPTANSWLRLGKSNLPLGLAGFTDPPADSGDGIRIRTDENLWLEANNSYGNYVVGVPDSGPAGIQDLIEKMHDFQGDFQPTNVMLFDSTASFPSDVTSDAGKWAHLVDNGQVKIGRHDTFITQEGNIYDFGGYWNYNLGNCYVENHMAQNAQLNRRDSLTGIDATLGTISDATPDLMDAGGPGWTSIGSNDISDKGSWDNGSVWVEKKYGNSYEYTQGSSVEVTVGSSQEVQYGGRHVETKYSGSGQKTYHGVSESGVSEEWKYCRDTGNLLAYSTSKQYSNTINTMDFTWSNKASAEFNFSSLASASFNFSAAASFNFSASGSFAINIEASMDIILDAKIMEIELKAPAGLHIKVEKGGGVDINLPGIKIKTEAPVKTTTSVADIKTALNILKSEGNKIQTVGAYITSPMVRLFA